MNTFNTNLYRRRLNKRSAVWFKIPKNASTSLRAGFMRLDKDTFDWCNAKHREDHLVTATDLMSCASVLSNSVIGDLTYEIPVTGKIAMVLGTGYQNYINRFRYYYDNCFTFTVVRNPWSRALSGFRYLTGCGYYDKPSDGKEELVNFKDTLRLSRGVGKSVIKDHLFNPQTDCIPTDDDQVQLNAVFRVESLSEDLKQLSDFLGCDEFKFPVIRRTNKNTTFGNYLEFYDDEARELVADMFSKDIRVLKYKFDGDT